MFGSTELCKKCGEKSHIGGIDGINTSWILWRCALIVYWVVSLPRMPGKPAGWPYIFRLGTTKRRFLHFATGIQGRGDTPKWYIPGTQLTFFSGLKLPMFESNLPKYGVVSVLGIIYVCMFQIEKLVLPLQKTNPIETTIQRQQQKSRLKKNNTNKIGKNSLEQTKPIRTYQVFQLLLFFYTHISSVHQKSRQNKEKHHQKRRFWKIPRFFSPEN